MRCPMGCRKNRERITSAERSAAYYRTQAGSNKKKALNRKRSLISASRKKDDSGASHPTEQEALPVQLCYYRWLIQLLDGIRMKQDELKQFCERIRAKVRQRGHEFRDHLRHNYRDRARP